MAKHRKNNVNLWYIQGFLSSVGIEQMDLSLRTVSFLKRAGLASALDIQRALETGMLPAMKKVGKYTVREVKDSMNALLADRGFDLTVDKLKLFDQDGSGAASSRQPEASSLTTLYHKLPIGILAGEVDGEVLAGWKAAQFETVGEVVDLSPQVTSFLQNVPVSLAKLIGYHKKVLGEKLAAGKLHPQVHYQDRSLAAWLDLAPDEQDAQSELLFALIQLNSIESLNQELSVLLADCTEREQAAFFMRFHERRLLKDMKAPLAVTRERVRQISLAATRKIWARMPEKPGIYFQTAVLAGSSLDEQLSLPVWRDVLLSRQIMDAEPVWQDIDAFDALCAILRSNLKLAVSLNLEMDERLMALLNQPEG